MPSYPPGVSKQKTQHRETQAGDKGVSETRGVGTGTRPTKHRGTTGHEMELFDSARGSARAVNGTTYTGGVYDKYSYAQAYLGLKAEHPDQPR